MKYTINLDSVLNKRKSISRQFHEETKIKKLVEPLDQGKWPAEWKTVYFKSYPRFPCIKLPEPELSNAISLKEVLYERHSTRLFSRKPLTMKDLSNLLFFSAGIKGYSYIIGGERFYASAGARYPLELYPLILNVRDLKNGIYHYYVKNHGLEELNICKGIEKQILSNINLNWVLDSAMILLITAVFYRNQMKYYERGYRHILSEVGHVSQNFYLLSQAFGIGCCSLGGYFDDGFNQLLDLETDVEVTVGAIAFGAI